MSQDRGKGQVNPIKMCAEARSFKAMRSSQRCVVQPLCFLQHIWSDLGCSVEHPVWWVFISASSQGWAMRAQIWSWLVLGRGRVIPPARGADTVFGEEHTHRAGLGPCGSLCHTAQQMAAGAKQTSLESGNPSCMNPQEETNNLRLKIQHGNIEIIAGFTSFFFFFPSIPRNKNTKEKKKVLWFFFIFFFFSSLLPTLPSRCPMNLLGSEWDTLLVRGQGREKSQSNLLWHSRKARITRGRGDQKWWDMTQDSCSSFVSLALPRVSRALQSLSFWHFGAAGHLLGSGDSDPSRSWGLPSGCFGTAQLWHS